MLQEFPAYTVEGLLAADWRQLMAILDYRRAHAAIDLLNSGSRGFEELRKRPDLAELLVEMGRAQSGGGLTLDVMLANKAAESPDDEDED